MVFFTESEVVQLNQITGTESGVQGPHWQMQVFNKQELCKILTLIKPLQSNYEV